MECCPRLPCKNPAAEDKRKQQRCNALYKTWTAWNLALHLSLAIMQNIVVHPKEEEVLQYARVVIDEELKAARMQIYVRRGGPNYQKGLAKMRALGEEIGIPNEVYGPEATMTGICQEAIQYITAAA
ncbi:Succinyl-CoA synthetase-like [Sesbania bispinosa]|nr:Succinyl-CoA synthetase-like [Sesbania bispinosa]